MMEERSQRAKIGGSGRRWQVLPVLAGVGLLIAMLLVAQTPEPPAPLPTATVVAEVITTPSISIQPTPSGPISTLPTTDLSDQQLLLVDDYGEILIWDGTSPTQTRGTIEGIFGGFDWELTVDRQRDVMFIRTFYWLEARSLRDNRRLWQLPIIDHQANPETTILDVVSDPFNQLVWLVEKQRTSNPFQPATVRLRGLDSVSGLELRRYQAPATNSHPQVLPSAYGPWLLADGQLFPFNQEAESFGEPVFSQLEFAQVAPDGRQALMFGNGELININLATGQILGQTMLEGLPQVNHIESMFASPDLNYVVVIGTSFAPVDLAQQIFAYDRQGKQVGGWQRQLLEYRLHGIETDVSMRIRFLDDQRLVLLQRTGALEIIELATGKNQLIGLPHASEPDAQPKSWAGFGLIPNLTPQPLVENPALERLEFKLFTSAPLTSAANLQALGIATIDGQVIQLWNDGSFKHIQQSHSYSIARANAPALLVDVVGDDLVIFDPTSQTTRTLDLEPAEAKRLADLAGIIAPDGQSAVLCYSYHFDASANSRVNRCLELDLETGQTSLFAELPAATYLTPIYWDGQQLTIVGKTSYQSQQPDEYLVWQTMADDRSQGQTLLRPLDLQQLWYVVGSPTVIYQTKRAEIYSYQVVDQRTCFLTQSKFNHSLQIDLAPDGQSIVLTERQYPLKYGTLRMIDTVIGIELWRDGSINYQSGQWSGDSQFYLIDRYQTVNSSVDTYTRQGKLGHSLLVSEGFGQMKSDWSGQRIVLQMFSELFLLERVNEHWLPLSKFPDFQSIYASRSTPTIAYVYPAQ